MSVQYPVFDLNSENISQSDTDVFDPPLVCLLITAPGAVTIKNGRDESVLITVGADATEPFYWWGQIRKVMDTGTAVANADLIGLRISGQTAHVHE